MNVGLKVTYLWHDVEVLEVRVVAENAAFRGTADVYVGTGELFEAATTLEGFPRERFDKRVVVLGNVGPKTAGGAVSLDFYCTDLAGHTAFRATVEADYLQHSQSQSATVFVDFEPAALDQFLAELQDLEREHRGTAVLIRL